MSEKMHSNGNNNDGTAYSFGIPSPAEMEPINNMLVKSERRPFSLLCPKCGATDRFYIRIPERGGEESVFCDKCHSLLEQGVHYSGDVDYIRHLLTIPPEKVHPVNTDSSCFCCGQRSWWISTAGKRVCGICHPPAKPEIVREWVSGKTVSSAVENNSTDKNS